MLRVLTFAAALAIGSASGAQTLDKNGKCHDDKGRFAKAELCAGKAKPAATAMPAYKLDTAGRCRDQKGKMAKKEMCAAK